MSRSELLIADIRDEFPEFRIVDKRRSALSLAIHVLLCVVTLGGQRRYLSHYHTVIGDTLYVPDAWAGTPDLERAILLRHERVHLRQRRRYGTIGMTLLYLLPFFPMGLAYGRARLEWEAYTETLRATAELSGLAAAEHPELRRQIVRRFTGPDYGFMWPFRRQVERWYDAVLDDLRKQHGRAATDHGSSGRLGKQVE